VCGYRLAVARAINITVVSVILVGVAIAVLALVYKIFEVSLEIT
jgi:hypothetical protein